jgi:hypothetical protein
MTQNRGRRMALPPPERVARGLRARLNVTAVLALVLPLLTVGALSLVRQADVADPRQAPSETALDLAVLACPSGITEDGVLRVSSATSEAGSVDVGPVGGAGSTTSLNVPADTTAEARPGRDPVTVRASGAMAPALSAARADAGPAATSCVAPQPEQWFTGLGAAAKHSSVLELVNPDHGPADADISLIASRGPVEAPSLRGITVPGGSSLRVELAREIPLRGEISAEVVVSRGRVGVFVVDTYDELGRGNAGVDWLAAQQPSEVLTILGLPSGAGSRALVVANDGDDEARVVVRVVTSDSAFRPEGLDDIRVPPHSVVRVPLTGSLGQAVKDGAVGVQLEATRPVTATLRSFVAGDISDAVPLTPFSEATQAILPDGQSTVLLSSAFVAAAEVVSYNGDGDQKTSAVDLSPGRTVSVKLPKDAVLVTVTPSSAPVRGAVVTTDGGTSVLGLRELVRTRLVPGLRSALP